MRGWLRRMAVFAGSLLPAVAFAQLSPVGPDAGSQAVSISTSTQATVAGAPSAMEAVFVAGCPVNALPSDLSTSGSERAPNLRFRFGRSVYLILASEMA